MKRKSCVVLLSLLLSTPSWASGIVGLWRTVDDKTHKPKATVEIVEQNGLFLGKIIKLEPDIDPNCGQCEESQRGKPLIGRVILRNLQAVHGDANAYEGGEITDPNNGKVYRAKATVIEGGRKLEVRGYIGISLFGRTQTWHRVQ